MTTKTKRTLAAIDALAGVPHLHGSRPHLVVPQGAWICYVSSTPVEQRDWWQGNRKKYDTGLLFKLSQ